MKQRILVVDDDFSIRVLYRAVLERERYEVFEVCDGIEALEAVERVRPDAIIMDAIMPNMDGMECTRRLKSNPETQDIPVIMVSARTESEEIEAGLEAGADEYVTKPVRFKELILRVRSMTRLYHSKEDLKKSNAVRGEQARAMQLLFDFSRRLASAGSLDNVYKYTVAAASELTCCLHGSITFPCDIVPDPSDMSTARFGAPSEAPHSQEPNNAVVRRVFVSGKSEYAGDTEPANSKTPFCASVPILSRNSFQSQDVVAVLSLWGRFDDRPMEPRDREYVDLVCTMAATEIEEQQGKEACDRALDAIVVGLGALAEYRDSDTGDHLARVTGYTLILAKDLRRTEPYAHVINDRFLEDLRRAIPLHDIGKVGIPDAILLKPGKLTDEEFATMQTHAELGATVIQSVIDQAPATPFLQMARDIARSHHEKYDGSGYPHGLIGDGIPLVGRIAAVADVYDALTSERPYKKAMSHEVATRILREGTGTHFDPAVLDAFWKNEAEIVRLSAIDSDEATAPSSTRELARSEC